MVAGEFDGSEHVLRRTVLGTCDYGFVGGPRLTTGPVLRVRAVEFRVALDDGLGLPFRGVLLRVEEGTRCGVGDLRVLALTFAGRGLATGGSLSACRGLLAGARGVLAGRAGNRRRRSGRSQRRAGVGSGAGSGAGVDDGSAAGRRFLIAAGELLEALPLFVGESVVAIGAAVLAALRSSLICSWERGSPTRATRRNTSRAEERTRLRVSSSGLPGRLTTMFLSPWVVISASETPVESTRWRMMATA